MERIPSSVTSGPTLGRLLMGLPINNRPNVGPDVTELGILSITPQSEGNGNGIGMGNFISRRVRDELDESMTVINALTGMKPFTAMIPPTMETDELVFKACIKAAGRIAPEDLRMAIIRNTGNLERIWVSKALAKELEPERGSLVGDYFPVPFEGNGALKHFWK